MCDFDYKLFAHRIKNEAKELVPAKFSQEQNQYIVDTVFNLVNIAGALLAFKF